MSDLIFGTKITSAAAAAGLKADVIRTAGDLDAWIDGGGSLVLVDLEGDVDVAEVVARCRGAETPPRVVAFGPHVRRDLLDAARDAGADEVMPRSAFAGRLEAIIRAAGPP